MEHRKLLCNVCWLEGFEVPLKKLKEEDKRMLILNDQDQQIVMLNCLDENALVMKCSECYSLTIIGMGGLDQ